MKKVGAKFAQFKKLLYLCTNKQQKQKKMKLKHWQGYGCVTATKISSRNYRTPFEEKRRELKIKVQGNHEWGIQNNDIYNVFRWLVKRFDKSIKDDKAILTIQTDMSYEGNEEVCIYTIILDIDYNER